MNTPDDPSQLQELSYVPLLYIIQAMFNTSNEHEFIEAFERYQTKLNFDGIGGSIHDTEGLLEHVAKHNLVQAADLVMQWAKPKHHMAWKKGIRLSASTEMMDVFLGHAPALTEEWLGGCAHDLKPKMFAHCFATFLNRSPQHKTKRSDEEIAEVLRVLVRGDFTDHVEAIAAHLDEEEATTTLYLAATLNKIGIIDVLYTVKRADEVLRSLQEDGDEREGQREYEYKYKHGVYHLKALQQRSFDRQELIDEVHHLGTHQKRPSKM